MKINCTETGTATVRVELSLSQLRLLRRITQFAMDQEGAPYGAKTLAQPLDRAITALAEDMRYTADSILDR
jgi:hypothetical protein